MTLRFPRRTARLRLTALYGSLFLLSGAVLVAGTYVLFQRATTYSKPNLPQVPHTPALHKLHGLSPASAFSALSDAQHQLTLDQHQLKQLPLASGGSQPQLALISPLLHQDEHRLAQDQRNLARATHQLARAVHQAAQAGTIEAAQRASDSHELLVDSGIALGVVALLALLAGWLVAGRMLRPIRTITRAARRISSTSLHERLALTGPEDELKELGDTLDDLFARLEAAFEAQRRFVAHASHELRTPLTRERALVQVALGDPSTPDSWKATGEELLASNREQERLLEALLTLASSESGLDRHELVDLADLVGVVLRDRSDRDRLRLQIETTLAVAPVDGDPRLLEHLIANLVENAIRHNVERGHVHISTASRGGDAVLTVANSGAVVPATEVDRLFQPFQRLDGHRTHRRGEGHGLGLSIVRAIAIAHGATITAKPLPEGGLSLSVAFPASPTPATIHQPATRAHTDQRATRGVLAENASAAGGNP